MDRAMKDIGDPSANCRRHDTKHNGAPLTARDKTRTPRSSQRGWAQGYEPRSDQSSRCRNANVSRRRQRRVEQSRRDATRRSLNRRVAAASAPISIEMSPQTTTNNASAFQQQALVRQFDRVLQDANRAL